MKKISVLLLMFYSITAIAAPLTHKKESQFTGDVNGDGYTDLVVADHTNHRDFFGVVKVFYGNALGIDTAAGWTYTCDINNFLESDYSVNITGDVNGDGTDDLCLLLTNLSKTKSGRSHQDIFLFYGSKNGLSKSPVILKAEHDNKDKISLRSVFDFDYNGDGITDILAEASERSYMTLEENFTDNNKKLVIYRGTDTGISSNYEVIRNIDDITLRLPGDLNNDGIIDLLSAEPTKKGVEWTQLLGNTAGTINAKTVLSYQLPPVISAHRIWGNIAGDFNGDHYDDFCLMYQDGSPLLKKVDSTAYTLEFYAGSKQGLLDSAVYKWQIKTAPGIIMNSTSCYDLNKDGYGDFIVQLYTPIPKALRKMEAFILWGGENGLSMDTTHTFNTLFHSAYLVNYGLDDVNPLGDINNDGCADLMLGIETIAYGTKEGVFKLVKLNFAE